MSLWAALAASSIVHLAVLLWALIFGIDKDGPLLHEPVQVEYVKMAEDAMEPAREASDTKTAAETPEVEMGSPTTGPSETKPPERPAKKPEDSETRPEEPHREESVRKSRDYINYFQLIREKVRSNLKKKYTDRDRQGDVPLLFDVGSDGRLLDARCGAGCDPALAAIALESLLEASPFPRFPRGLSFTSMSFNLTVSFKKN